MNTYATEGRRELFYLSDQLDQDVARYVLERDRLYVLQNGTSHLEVSMLPEEAYDLQESMRALTEIIIRKNTPFVCSMAKRFARKGREDEIEISDLKQEGLLGLVRALELYNPEKGGFVNYASKWISSNMNRYRKNNFSLIKIPVEVQQIIFKVKKAAIKDGNFNYEKTSNEIGVDEETIRYVLEARKIKESDLSLEETTRVIPRLSVEEIIAEKELREIVRNCIGTLPEREWKIIISQYFEEKTNIEIGRELGLNESRIRLILTKTLKTLEKRLLSAGLYADKQE